MNQMPVPIWAVESYGAYRVMDASGLLCGHRLTQVSMCMAEIPNHSDLSISGSGWHACSKLIITSLPALKPNALFSLITDPLYSAISRLRKTFTSNNLSILGQP